GGTLRRPAAERTLANKEKAVGHACYRALLYVFPEDEAWLTGQARKAGLDPKDASTPAQIARKAVEALVAYRRGDGANQHGDEVGSEGKPYSDFTYYRCANTAARIVDPDCWQPIEFDDGKGGKVTPGFLTPHWYRVKPFALRRSDQFRPAGPPRCGSAQMRKEIDEVLKYNASLTVQQKAIVEFMRDGPRSTGQSGHWLRFAQAVSRRDGGGLDADVKLYFAVGNAVFDAFIACWEAKRHYDSSRPWTLIRHLHKGKKVAGWGGAGKGVVLLPAEKWHPYSPLTFITPPFPGYPSGHSTASGAAAKMLELFTGSDRFGAEEYRKAGELTEPGFECRLMMSHLGKPGDAKLTCDVALRLPTFSATAEMAGLSRVMGGYHIQTDNVDGLKLGRDVAEWSWPRYKAYFEGTAKARE
ncbi:MAG: vanadium-dependent haloperoxidase, partial [Gemmataceae bacterium]|nr:vanadium-dependent haloperoxidase [Gemmataceae bacterium]